MSPNSSKCHNPVWIQAVCLEAQGRFLFVLFSFLLGSTSHWHHPLVLQGPADPVPILFLLEGGIMEGSLEDAPQLLVVLQVTSISHLWSWSWRWHELGSTCHAQ